MSKEKDQHISVFVRIKPVSTTDALDEDKCIVKIMSDKEIKVYDRSQDRSKMFTYDGIFGPTSTQMDVYNTVVSPLLKEVIAGYNCTVFVYGQTGTGKTYTMEGNHMDNSNWQSDTSAGIIPRCLSHLFDELQLLENQQYIVRVNFLELYNEELFDLLTDEDVSSKIKLYEDMTKKGSVIIHGLKEVIVHNKAEIYRILEKGSKRRQTAATILNSNSSRSHSVFSIMTHIKENTSGSEEELLKTARLNLVDLAGSENVGKIGTVDKKETKYINQSLLTLSRVITALVEKAPHIPYRESKLTRLLQESLGGRTKTSIIATISSVSDNLEETLSTLDYAHRAKNITNRPEINQKVCKKALLKKYTEEIERLRRDLVATREKNGIYVSLNDYDTMQMLIDCQREEIKEKRNYCKILEDIIKNKEKIFNDLQSQYDTQADELTKNTSELNDMNSCLQSTRKSLRKIECDKNKQKRLVEKHVEVEKILRDQMETILDVINEAIEDAQKLHDRLDHKRKVEEENEKFILQMRSDFTKCCENSEDVFLLLKKEIHAFLQSVKDETETYIVVQTTNMKASIRLMDFAVKQHFTASKKSLKNINSLYICSQKALNTHTQDTLAIMKDENKLLTDIYSKLAPDILDLFESNYNRNFKENLQFLSRNITQKLESMSMYAKHIMETICKNRLEECIYFRKNLSEISEHINRIFGNEKQIMENYKEFGKKMEDLSYGFNILNKCEKNYSEIINTSHQIDEICSNALDQNSHGYNTDIIKQNDLKDFLQNITSLIKSDIDNGINQMQMSNKTAIEKGNILVSDLQKRLSTGCDTLKRYNNNVQTIGKQLQTKMVKDKNKIFISSANIFEMIKNMGLIYVKLMEEQQNKIIDDSKMMDNNFTNERIELNNYNNNIFEELRASQKRIDKFLTEDFYRDICTDTTPERKIFSYPREFAKMSPLKRINQRIRKSRNHSDEIENNL